MCERSVSPFYLEIGKDFISVGHCLSPLSRVTGASKLRKQLLCETFPASNFGSCSHCNSFSCSHSPKYYSVIQIIFMIRVFLDFFSLNNTLIIIHIYHLITQIVLFKLCVVWLSTICLFSIVTFIRTVVFTWVSFLSFFL